VDDFLGEVDVLQGKPERLPLPEPKARSDHKEELVAVGQGRLYRQHPFGWPRLDPAGCGGRRANRAGPTWIASEATVLDGGLEDAVERRPNETDRGRTEVLLQPLLPVAQDFCADSVERLSAQVGNDVPAYPLLDPFDRGRVTALGGLGPLLDAASCTCSTWQVGRFSPPADTPSPLMSPWPGRRCGSCTRRPGSRPRRSRRGPATSRCRTGGVSVFEGCSIRPQGEVRRSFGVVEDGFLLARLPTSTLRRPTQTYRVSYRRSPSRRADPPRTTGSANTTSASSAHSQARS